MVDKNENSLCVRNASIAKMMMLMVAWFPTVNPCTDKKETVFSLGNDVGCAAIFPVKDICKRGVSYTLPQFRYYYPPAKVPIQKDLKCFVYYAVFAEDSPIICMCSTPKCNKMDDVPKALKKYEVKILDNTDEVEMIDVRRKIRRQVNCLQKRLKMDAAGQSSSVSLQATTESMPVGASPKADSLEDASPNPISSIKSEKRINTFPDAYHPVVTWADRLLEDSADSSPFITSGYIILLGAAIYFVVAAIFFIIFLFCRSQSNPGSQQLH